MPCAVKRMKTIIANFPDPDLLPVMINEELIQIIKTNLPLLPSQIEFELRQIPTLKEEDIYFVLSAPEIYHFYQKVKKSSTAGDKLIINWLKDIMQQH